MQNLGFPFFGSILSWISPTSLYSCFGSPKFSYLVPQAGKISSLFPNYSYLEHPTEVYC